jgi:biotin transporter BioY
MVYPLVAGLAGYVLEKGKLSFVRAAVAGLLAEIVLFAGGIAWLAIGTRSLSQAVHFGLYWFVFAEIIKIMFAAAVAARRGPRIQV